MDSVGKSVKGIGVVKGLGAQHLEEHAVAHQGRAVINVLIGLHNPDELLNGVVKVQLNLVGRRAHRLVARELQLRDEVLVGLLGEASALVRVQEHIVDVQRRGDQRLVVGNGGGDRCANLEVGGDLVGRGGATERGNGPQALVDGANVQVDFDFVILESDQRKGQTRVGAKPKLEGHVEGGLGKGIAGSAHLAGRKGVARAIHLGERGVGDEGQLGGVANHLEVATLLLGGHGKLIPDMHPVTVLAVNALAANLHLHLGDELLTGKVQPASIDTVAHASGDGRDTHELVNLGESHLQVCAVSKIAVAADGALHTTAEISLAVEGLLDRLNRKVGVSAIRHLPKGDLGVAGEVNVLGAIGDNLQKCSGHGNIIFLKYDINMKKEYNFDLPR